MQTSKTAKTLASGANAFEIRKLDAFCITDDDVFDLSFSVDEGGDLAIQLVGKLRKLACKLLGNDLARWNSALIKFFQASDLVRL